ncbi:MAG: hypothetical protein H6568_15815 [Lewinellaceae bacterium]|nr:hypothetical protein [Lewinellaceae bacterium]
MKQGIQEDRGPLPEDDQPPIMGSWNRLYILVLVIHVIFITLFYLITQSLS